MARKMKEKMLAAVFEGEGRLNLKRVPLPRIKRPDEVLLEVEAASICGTDVHILEVPPGHPATPGVVLSHEYTGKVLEVGKEVTQFKVNDRVVIDPNIACGSCSYCQRAMPNMCENMITLGIFTDGGFAEYNVAPAKALHRILSQLPAEQAVFAEPLSCVVNATRKLKVQPGESVVVLGAGPIGLLFTRLFKVSGASEIIVCEVSSYRKKFAVRSGASRVVDPGREDLYGIVEDKTHVGADVVVDAVGDLFQVALKLTRRGGRILLFGQNEKAQAQISQNMITRCELNIMGTYISRFTFPSAIQIIESGLLNLQELITHRFPLKEIRKGMQLMGKREAIKVVITP